MSDFDMRARRAGTAARHEAQARLDRLGPLPTTTRHRDRRRWTLVAATGTVAVLLVALAVVLDLTPVPTSDAVAPPGDVPDPIAEDGVLPVPDEGEVLAAYLDDGRPVFISHPVAGDVLVLDGEVPHGVMRHLNAFCPSSRWFEDPWYASRFNFWGDYTDGPAPTGMRAYPSTVSDDGTRVRVTGPPEPAPDRDELRGEPYSPQGPACVDGMSPDTAVMVLHHLPETRPGLDGHEVPSDRWVWANLVLANQDGRAAVCDADGTCPPEAPSVAGLEDLDDEVTADRRPRPYLARADEDGTVHLLAPADRTRTLWD